MHFVIIMIIIIICSFAANVSMRTCKRAQCCTFIFGPSLLLRIKLFLLFKQICEGAVGGTVRTLNLKT